MLIDTVECSLERLLAPRLDDVHVRSSDRSALWGHPAWNRRTEYRDCDRGRSAWQPASSHGFVAGRYSQILILCRGNHSPGRVYDYGVIIGLAKNLPSTRNISSVMCL
jgi:hypothetical protein